MRISELNNKSFLGAAGAAENSYIIINYQDTNTDRPVTYKATLNVDEKNPISYHLYTSLGFKRMFSQAIYLK